MTNQIEKLKKIINESNNIVVLSGAGVSTDSGLKDFRSENGIYKTMNQITPEEMLSLSMFQNHPKEFYDFYRKNFNCLDAKPNQTHLYLKKLEDEGKLKAIITQNIDGLHTKAGNKNVLEIHGSIYRNYCTKCHAFYDAKMIFDSIEIPYCQKCGGIIKPDVVLYEESLPSCYEKSIQFVQDADTLIVIGTSLKVEPASSLIKFFQGTNLVIINNEKTSYDCLADLVIHENLSQVIFQLTSSSVDNSKT